MADFWLINGKTALVRKASRRLRKHKNPKEASMARHRKSHKKSHRRSRRASRKARRSFHRNPPSLSLGNVGTALLWGGAGFAASKLAASYIRRYLPAMIPAQDLVSAAASGALVSYAGGKFAKSETAKAAIRVGAFIPAAEAAINMTALGSLLGTQKVLMIAPSAGQPSGVAAALSAALSADLSDDESMYSGY